MNGAVDILVQVLHCLAGLIVVAEALNKIERTRFLARGRSSRENLVVWLKGIAWVMLCVGGGGAVITPMLHLEKPTPQDMLLACGFAVLIIRTRIKEG